MASPHLKAESDNGYKWGSPCISVSGVVIACAKFTVSYRFKMFNLRLTSTRNT